MMIFSDLKNEISRMNGSDKNEVLTTSDNAIEEIKEKYLKDIYGGAGGDSAGLGAFNAWGAWHKAI